MQKVWIVIVVDISGGVVFVIVSKDRLLSVFSNRMR